MTTNWVLAGQYQGFPLMYHWRILPDTGLNLSRERVERAIAYWGGGPEVRRRIEALQQSSASLVLFLEFIPQTLQEWLTEQIRAGDETADLACSLVERELEAGTYFMNDRGLLHFDAHFQNILTDGRRLYFADFGLALSSRFDLSPAEYDFFNTHRTYDRAYSISYLVNWLTTALYGHKGSERELLIRACAEGKPSGGPAEGHGDPDPPCAACHSRDRLLPQTAEREPADPVPAGGDPQSPHGTPRLRIHRLLTSDLHQWNLGYW